MKRTFKMKPKAFFIIFKGLSLRQINPTFLDNESETLKEIVQRTPKPSYFSKRINKKQQ